MIRDAALLVGALVVEAGADVVTDAPIDVRGADPVSWAKWPMPNYDGGAVLLPNHPSIAIEAPMKKEGDSFASIDIDVPFKVAKQKLVDEFDRRYLKELLEAHDGNISAAARAAGIERMSIYKMIRRLGLDKDTEQGRAPTAPGDEDDDSYSDSGV